jgi:hypothetical protein
MNTNRIFNWLLVALFVALTGVVSSIFFGDIPDYEDELATVLARYGETYGTLPGNLFVVIVIGIIACVPVSIVGLWLRHRWGIVLYALVLTLPFVLVLFLSDTVFVTSKQSYAIETFLNGLSIVILLFALLRRADLGFRPLFGGKKPDIPR